MNKDKPQQGKMYSLTSGFGDKSIANGNSWKDSEIKEKYKVGDYEDNIYFVRKAYDKDDIFGAGMNFDPTETEYRGERVRIDKIITLADIDFRKFESDFLVENPQFEYIGGHDGVEEYTHTVLVRHVNGNEKYFVNTEGYNYARYVGIKNEIEIDNDTESVLIVRK